MRLFVEQPLALPGSANYIIIKKREIIKSSEIMLQKRVDTKVEQLLQPVALNLYSQIGIITVQLC